MNYLSEKVADYGEKNVALCFFGQMRTYERCYGHLKENILEELNPDIFIHTWKEKGGTWKECYDEEVLDKTVTQENLEDYFSPKNSVIEEFKESYYEELGRVSVPQKVQNLPEFKKGMVPMFYKMNAVNQLKKEYEEENDMEYDLVVLTRPDILVLDKIPQKVLDNPNVFWCTGGGFYKINDTFTVSSSENIDYFTSIWDKLNHYWRSELDGEYKHAGVPKTYTIEDPMHIGIPERIIHYHLKQSPLDVRKFDMKSAVLRRQEPLYKYKLPDYEWENLHIVTKAAILLVEQGPKNFLRKSRNFISNRN